MKEKTAVMLMIEWADSDNQLDQYAVSKIKEKAEELLELEKNQIIYAFQDGFFQGNDTRYPSKGEYQTLSEAYFTDTYEQPK